MEFSIITEDRFGSDVLYSLATRRRMRRLKERQTMIDTRLSLGINRKSLGELQFVISIGRLDMISRHIRLSNVITLVNRSQVSFILHRGESETHQTVSEAYIDEIMDRGSCKPPLRVAVYENGLPCVSGVTPQNLVFHR